MDKVTEVVGLIATVCGPEGPTDQIELVAEMPAPKRRTVSVLSRQVPGYCEWLSQRGWSIVSILPDCAIPGHHQVTFQYGSGTK